jgi:hypothetical protein
MKGKSLNLMTMLAKKNRLRCETLVLAAGLLVMGVEDEDFHRDARKGFVLNG